MNAQAFRFKILKQFRNSGSPVEGVFELTGRCNFNCKMCYVHTKSNTEFLKTEKNGDWWISQIDAACDRGMLFALLTGGECMLHPDFERIYTYLRKKGIYTRINTNGLLLTQKKIDFLKKNPPLEIQLTLYGSNDDAYVKVTGVPAFSQVEAAIARVREAGIALRVAVTPNPFAPGETERIINYLKSIEVPYSVADFMFSAYDDTSAQTMSDIEVSIDEKIRFMKQQYEKEYIPVPEAALPPVGGNHTEEVRGIRCSAGRVVFTISHEGCMMPCTALYHLRVPINEQTDFNAAWDKMLNISSNYVMPVECEGCAYQKACFACVVARTSKTSPGHCDPAVCEMTRKLVAAGVKKLDQQEAAKSEHSEL